jgi:hypothetical protein
MCCIFEVKVEVKFLRSGVFDVQNLIKAEFEVIFDSEALFESSPKGRRQGLSERLLMR